MRALALALLLPVAAHATEGELRLGLNSSLAVPIDSNATTHGVYSLDARYGIPDLDWLAIDTSVAFTPVMYWMFRAPGHTEHYEMQRVTLMAGPALRWGDRWGVSFASQLGMRWSHLNWRFSSPGVPPTLDSNRFSLVVAPQFNVEWRLHDRLTVLSFARSVFDSRHLAKPELSAGAGLAVHLYP